ncbi:MAG: ATP-binding protein [Clostridia bacterium]|nr:ATP-binding protein [Clostridia bacterium]
MFNYEIKKQSYSVALQQAKQLLLQNDMQNGLYYINRAIQLNFELSSNCIIPEIRSSLIAEGQKLQDIASKVSAGQNPFLRNYGVPAQQAPQSPSMPQNTQGAENKPIKEQSSANKVQDGNELAFFKKESPSVTLEDIAGLDEVKKQIRLNVIAPIKNPELFYAYKEEAGCQILMYGPPGCGKSFVAEAIAGELQCAYAIVNASDILDKYVGEAPKKITKLFEESKQFDNCLIFFDELDALFASRESSDSSHTKDVLTTFLTCLSGFSASKNKDSVRVIIGATNRPWILDSALIRGKRFDTHIYVGLPDEKARTFMVKRAFRKHGALLENTDITVEDLVEMFDGYSGADLTSLIDKMKSLALSRAIENSAQGITEISPITKEDALTVLKGFRNSITKESLEMFESFAKGEI